MVLKTLLNICQKKALNRLEGCDNVFLTGVAGSGKSFLVRHFLKNKSQKTFPVLASTGASAILVGGRTFHSFFGLGILQGGPLATIERALKNKRLVKRLRTTTGAIIDEVSMISGQTLAVAETIARRALEKDLPWGGLKIIAVGDFAQLPPVNRFGREKDWAFLSDSWLNSSFQSAVLKTVIRTKDPSLVEILNHVRNGELHPSVVGFLNERKKTIPLNFEGTRLFPHRETAEHYNREQLSLISGPPSFFETKYSGDEKFLSDIKKNAPLPETLILKPGALVMMRLNDPQGRWVNGSLGIIKSIGEQSIKVTLFDGAIIELEQVTFNILNADGKEIASATNFPVNLAYATTIHKAQGLTLDQVAVDLKNLWEPGQAYVALSRVKSREGLYITDWSPSSLKSDPEVSNFNKRVWDEDKT